jgi:hypothetical protein
MISPTLGSLHGHLAPKPFDVIPNGDRPLFNAMKTKLLQTAGQLLGSSAALNILSSPQFQEALKRAINLRSDVRDNWGRQVDGLAGTFNLVTRQDLRDLKRQIRELENQVAALDYEMKRHKVQHAANETTTPTKASPAGLKAGSTIVQLKPPAAKKPAAKQAAAQKPAAKQAAAQKPAAKQAAAQRPAAKQAAAQKPAAKKATAKKPAAKKATAKKPAAKKATAKKPAAKKVTAKKK